MRELTLIGLDVDGKHVICEGGNPADKFLIRVDDRLRAAVRGDRTGLVQTARDSEVKGVLRPKDIQARIRAGASVEEVAESAGVDASKVERFAHPVLLERQRAAELATAAHPVLANGPAVETLLETITVTPNANTTMDQTISWTHSGTPANRAEFFYGDSNANPIDLIETVDNIAFSTTVPEPSTYAAIAFASAVGVWSWRRRRKA